MKLRFQIKGNWLPDGKGNLHHFTPHTKISNPEDVKKGWYKKVGIFYFHRDYKGYCY